MAVFRLQRNPGGARRTRGEQNAPFYVEFALRYEDAANLTFGDDSTFYLQKDSSVNRTDVYFLIGVNFNRNNLVTIETEVKNMKIASEFDSNL